MTAPWRKALRDLGRSRAARSSSCSRSRSASPPSAPCCRRYAILTRELNAGYLATNPASATSETDASTRSCSARCSPAANVGSAEARRSVRGRVRAAMASGATSSSSSSRTTRESASDRLAPQKGAWPPGKGEIAIERDAFQVARARIGDTVIVRTIGGTEANAPRHRRASTTSARRRRGWRTSSTATSRCETLARAGRRAVPRPVEDPRRRRPDGRDAHRAAWRSRCGACSKRAATPSAASTSRSRASTRTRTSWACCSSPCRLRPLRPRCLPASSWSTC